MCPICKKAVSTARVESVQLLDSNGATYNGAKFSCASCGSVLSLGIDPLAQRNDIVLEILFALGKATPLK